MNIRNRFRLLYLLIFCAFLIIGFFSHFSFQRIKNLNKIDKEVHRLYTQSLELRVIEGDYLSWELINPLYFKTGKSTYLDRFDTVFSNTSNLLVSISTDPFAKKIKVDRKLNSIGQHLNDFQKLFKRLEKEKRELGFKDWGIEGQMRKAIHFVEKEIEGINMPRLQVHMLMLRRHEKDYLLRRDIAYRDRFISEQASFCNSISGSGLASDQKIRIINDLDSYKSTFLKLIEKDQLIGESQSFGLLADLRTGINQIIAELSLVSDQISLITRHNINRIILILIIFIVVCATVAISIGAYIFNRILHLMGGEPEEVAIIANNIAKGNLQMRFDETKDYEGIMKTMVTMTRKITSIISNIYKSSDHVAIASSQFNATSQHLSMGAAQQSDSIEQIAETIRHINDKTRRNADDAQATEEISRNVKERVSEIKTQSDLSLATNKLVSNKIEIINDITKQTKILALNAAVEAARAGKHGSGFHIIAEEVKRLAEITGEAADEIGKLSRNSLNESKTISRLISDIVGPVEESTRLVRQISEASQEQSQGIDQISNNIRELNGLSQENAVASEEMASGTNELEQQTSSLNEMVGYFNIGDIYADDGRVISIKAFKNKSKKKKKKKKESNLN